MTVLRFEPTKQCVSRNDIYKNWMEEHKNYSATKRDITPRTDVLETAEEIVVTMDIPGVKKENIKLVIEDNILSVEGKKVAPEKADDDQLHRTEILYGEFKRAFTMPQDVETEDVKAKYEDGVLAITLKKYVPAAKQEKTITLN